MELQKGQFYTTLAASRNDNEELKRCIEETVVHLMSSDTTANKPGILLGKVQSGKTRAFLGVIALAFDNNYDIAIILTKGTKALSEQTITRLHEDFGKLEDDNRVQVHDIMAFPENMVRYELNQKLIIVAKKQIDNLKRTLKILTEIYPDLKQKKILIVDDEADYASISFHKEKDNGQIEQGTIGKQIDEIRSQVAQYSFLQVTATPYSLYLQPDDNNEEAELFLPMRPAFTQLLPIHEDYVGGDFYFVESELSDTVASCLYEEVPNEEVERLRVKKKLKRADRRSFKIEDVFVSASTKTIRNAVMNFLVGASIRRIQQAYAGERLENYSFVIHTEFARSAHAWQEIIVTKLNEELLKLAQGNHDLFRQLVTEAYEDLSLSIQLSELPVPTFEEVLTYVSDALFQGMLVVEKVNSEKNVKDLLDTRGQLKLRTPLNIFIGGQILDRGITIRNLIGFYYGRNPNKFQQDTVLQHSRMYGARSKADLAVTRFYTTRRIYEIMRKIHEFDNALREAFISGSHDRGVYFIRKDANRALVPCSPNKIMLSNITTLSPYRRLLPVGFQTDYKTNIKKTLDELDASILGTRGEAVVRPFLIPVEGASLILEKIGNMLVFGEDGYDWDMKSHIASLEYLSKASPNPEERGKVWVVVRQDSQVSRKKLDGRFSNDPDGGSSGETARVMAKKVAVNIPALVLIRVNGDTEAGWKGSPFWWPIIMAPQSTHPTVFASDTIK